MSCSTTTTTNSNTTPGSSQNLPGSSSASSTYSDDHHSNNNNNNILNETISPNSSASSASTYYSESNQPTIHNYIYHSYQQHYQNTSNLMASSNPPTNSAGMASAHLIADEPEFKKAKLTYYQLLNKQHLHNESAKSQSGTYGNAQTNMYGVHKKLEERIGGILCCTVCLDLPQAVIYQCNNGHLMCAGCFAHLLADARLKEDQATCPNCRCEISKNSCSRNLAVEKTLCELPANCDFCNIMYPRNCIEYHQSHECLERPVKCVYERIGCTWEGPYHELDSHREQCSHPNRPARDILPFLKEKDNEVNEENQSFVSLVNSLSFEKISFNDLQFKQYKTDELTPKLYFETNRFNAFFQQWVLKARINDNEKNPNLSLHRYISYQLILKSKLSSSQSSLDIKFCVLKGPFGEVPITPCVHSFEFLPNKSETDYIRFNISSADCNKLLGSKTINFRLFMFQA